MVDELPTLLGREVMIVDFFKEPIADEPTEVALHYTEVEVRLVDDMGLQSPVLGYSEYVRTDLGSISFHIFHLKMEWFRFS